MSTIGPTKDTSSISPSLITLITSDQEKAALELIKKDPSCLQTPDKRGYHPIHWAAIKGSLRIFKSLCKRGVNPYAVDENGFSPWYYAKNHKQTALLAYYEKNYPLEVMPKQEDKASNDIDEALQHSGLLAYGIEFKTDVDPQNYLLGLFSPVKMNTDPKRSKSSRPDFKRQIASQMNPLQLSQIAYGITEELLPADIVRLLTKQYPTMELCAKLACIYFIKELIRQDSANEWSSDADFNKAFTRFIEKIGNNLAMTSLKGKLQSYYQRRTAKQLPYLESVEAFTFDLGKLFSESIAQMSPKAFSAVNLLKNATSNQAFMILSERTNQLSQLVCRDILLASSPQEGAVRFVYYMNVINSCLVLTNPKYPVYNFAAAFAIYNGLQFNVIQRLTGIKKHVPEAYHKTMLKYDDLFHPSGKGLRALMLEYPNCIPVIAIYSADKDKISENKQLSDRIALFGKLNQQFAVHREYIASLAPLHAASYATDLTENLQRVTFNEVESYWYSYQLEPARILSLDGVIEINNMLIDLRLCRDIRAPLVVRQADAEYRGTFAKDKIITTLRSQNIAETSISESVTLCDKVIQQYADDMPASLKQKSRRPKRQFARDDAASIEKMTDTLVNLKIAENDIVAQRARALTEFDLSQKQRRLSDAGQQRRYRAPAASSSSTFTPLLASRSSSSSSFSEVEKPADKSSENKVKPN